MARIEDEIGKIADPVLRTTILDEVKKLKADKRFGLVFEEHLPELVPVYSAKVKARSLVARRGRTFSETFKVVRVHDSMAEVEKSDGSRESIPVEQLTVIRRFGEPIYPALRTFDRVRNGDTSQPHHILIEADNYHALQLLEYCYSGKVDCIYIDPPYNTGAKDWKYNNDYVDGNDTWRHSKWLSMMRKRLELARRLLKPDTGVLVATIDDNEFQHLRCLLADIFPSYNIFNVVIEHNKRGRQGEEFAKTHEYALFVCPGSADAIGEEPTGVTIGGETRNLRRTGNNSLRADRPNQFYPIWVHPDTLEIVRVGEPLSKEEQRNDNPADGLIPIWPIDKKGVERNWYYGPERLIAEYNLGKAFARRQSYGIHIYYTLKEKTSKRYKTVWSRSTLDASTYGSELLNKIFGITSSFSFPKSIYAVHDCLATACLHRKQAIVVDFFSGSGTTLNAVNLMNATDSGNRQCILVTNNEVSEDEATLLTSQGRKPGDNEWNKYGICQSVTFPRSKFTMRGHRDDGSELEGEYLTGRMVTKEKPRTFKQLGFTEGRLLSMAQRKQLVGLIDKVPQSKITAEMPFFVDDEIPASILFDFRQAEAWLEALEDQEHITDFYLVTQENKAFTSIKQQVQELLGPIQLEEEEKRPLKDGFPANLEYFKLDFLDPAEVQMGRQFAAILPILWMMAGARGPLPDAPDPHAPWLIPADCPFAVLIQEKRFKEFHRHVEGRDDLTHVFIVTDSSDTFYRLKKEFDVPHVRQLYKDYLDNFKINLGKE